MFLLLAQEAIAAPDDQSPADLFQQVSDSIVIVQADTPSGARQGSGVVIAANLVVTNQHVVDAVTTATITIRGRNVPARVRSVHVEHDLALLEADSGTVKPAALRASRTLRVGERAYAIGAPLGLEKTLSEGVVWASAPGVGLSRSDIGGHLTRLEWRGPV
ncbi:MAG: serine protease [Myxococcales bacterium]|nr:serine protease [Myxococcales bacterium]